MPEKFYKENYPIVYGFLLSLCGDTHMAEELTAETFCRALEKIHRYNPAYKTSTWLCTIAKRLYFNECCRRRKYISLHPAHEDTAVSLEDTHQKKEDAAAIRTILSRLSLKHQQLFFMRLGGMSFREIGLALGESENWARVTYYRVKCRIRTEMEGEL